MPRRSEIRAAVVGQVTHDRYGNRIVPGGCAYYSARTLQALGVNVSLITSVGADFACQESLAGLDVRKVIGERTTVFVNRYPENGPRVQWVEEVAPAILPGVAEDWISRPDILFIAPVFGEVSLMDWVRALDARIVGVGLQGFLKQKGALHNTVQGRRAVVRRPFNDISNRLRAVDVVFLSEEDIQLFGDRELLTKLIDNVPMVVMTKGDQGAMIFENQREIRVPARPTRVVDPTGAGDTFSAAFLYALANHAAPEQAGRLAADAASIVLEGEGGEKLADVSLAFDRP